ncbi:hypothetical protein Tco_0752541 [Tanacetum coccineum]|uniref:Uncharacterized protein n=1 Tax=Tanacetum coccineum TaxID=301880 RepID=A0ABQ4Z856_9ASTR
MTPKDTTWGRRKGSLHGDPLPSATISHLHQNARARQGRHVTIPVSAATITNVELTLAQTLVEWKSARPKTKGVVMKEPRESTPTISLQLSSQAKG